jgi:ABC-type uncharacterized transport system ATPase subunit
MEKMVITLNRLLRELETAVLQFSEDLDETFALEYRIEVTFEGYIRGFLHREEAAAQKVV